MSAKFVGATIDRFRIVEQLGRGGMGEVYVGYDEVLNRTVALKSIRREHRLNAEARVRFLREARVLSQLKHPNICQIYDYVERPEADFLVLELIEGRSLSRAMRDGLAYRVRLRIAEQIADALVAAHASGIVHRDLKPDNVMLAAGDVVKVLDFGLSRSEGAAAAVARHVGSDAPTEPAIFGGTDELTWRNTPTAAGIGSDATTDRVTALGAIMGTLGHMSPEQARGELATPASDLFSFGVLLHELFTGERAYPNVERAELLRKAQAGETVPVGGIDPDLAALIVRVESVTPSARPAAVEARDRLRWIADKPARARRKVLLGAAIGVLVLFSIAMAFQTIRARRAEAAARQEAERANREAEASRKVSAFLADIFKVSDPSEARGNSVTARELLDKGAAKIDAQLRDQPVVRARLMDTIGMVYLRLGLFDQAEPLLRSALSVRRQTLGAHDPDLAQSFHNLGILMWMRGDYPAAEPLFRSAIDVREASLGPDDADLAKSINSLAIVYKSEGKYALAEPLYLRSFRIMEKTLGPEHPDLASALNNLASLYFNEGKLAAAEPLLRRCLAIKEKALGTDHPDVASTLNNLGELMKKEKKYAEAETFYRRSLAIREKIFGPDHPDVAESLANVGELYVAEGKLAEAEPILQRSLAIREHALGAGHPDVGVTLGAIADLRHNEHRDVDAERLYVRAESILDRAGDDNLPLVLDEHAAMNRELGRAAEADALAARAEAFRKGRRE